MTPRDTPPPPAPPEVEERERIEARILRAIDEAPDDYEAVGDVRMLCLEALREAGSAAPIGTPLGVPMIWLAGEPGRTPSAVFDLPEKNAKALRDLGWEVTPVPVALEGFAYCPGVTPGGEPCRLGFGHPEECSARKPNPVDFPIQRGDDR